VVGVAAGDGGGLGEAEAERPQPILARSTSILSVHKDPADPSKENLIAVTPKLLTEVVGTFIFFTCIALSSEAGAFAPIAIGGALMVMVYMGGHISGAHYNPAVSLAVFLRKKMPAAELISYWAAQLVGGTLGFLAGYLVSGRTAGIHPGKGVYMVSAVTVEVLITAALALVVLNVAATKATAGNSFYGIAIGFTIVAGAFVAGPISGGAFNPAVGIAATIVDGVFHGGSWSDLWIYIVAPLVGGALGAFMHQLQQPVIEEPLAERPH
jgi:aquaporin Z